MRQLFLSHVLDTDTPFYGGDGNFVNKALRSINAGDTCNARHWSFPNHAGTHIDAPLHFNSSGKSLTDYPPDFWLFSMVEFIDISDVSPASLISQAQFECCTVSQSAELLLLKTGFGRFRSSSVYWQENPVFAPELAEYFRMRFPHLRAFGFDTISISSWTDRQAGRKAHGAFLGGEQPILLIEDMNLLTLKTVDKLTNVTVMPLLVNGADGAPCTVIGEVKE